MTKTHFHLIARVMNNALREQNRTGNSTSRMAIWDAARTLADEFEEVNPRFSREIFLGVVKEGVY